MRRDDRFASHAPFHFDLSVFDLFASCRAGATLVVIGEALGKDPARLGAFLAERRPSVWYSAPSILALLTQYGGLDRPGAHAPRLVLFAGEVFPIAPLRRLRALWPRADFWNLYGPTETNVCTYHEVTERPAADDPPLPIGRACENVRCEVVDEAGSVVSGAGAEGELRVRGSNVASGYWGDPERTARGFPEPHVYRTGDVVQILDDSTDPRYRFAGRRDHLVKTRGYRVELGEVEAALYAHPQVDECVVVPVPDELLGNRLAAFCTSGDEPEAGELGRACRERLPAYMVPERIVVVASLPRTPNDKYDRRALAEEAAEMLAAEAPARG
jgi:acyl-coenzyme A synthetase/AMP-(fatty) acid ligase